MQTTADVKTDQVTGLRFKVGIVGLQPGRSWATLAHIPALRALSETFEIISRITTSPTRLLLRKMGLKGVRSLDWSQGGQIT